MADRATAEQRLARILEIIPRAAREGGVSTAELASILKIPEAEVLRDLTEVLTRAFYRPAGAADDVQVTIEPSRISVWTTGEFRRPVRLNARESIALGIGLRALAASNRGDPVDPQPSEAAGGAGRDRLVALAERLEAGLLEPSGVEGMPRFALGEGAITPGAEREVLADAARDRRRCRIQYLKSGGGNPEVREIDPYVLLVSGGRWYAVGHCHRSGEVRVFRLDRILAATALDIEFEIPAEFDPRDYIADSRVYRAADFQEVIVRYSPRIARWIVEQGPVEALDDGSVVVRYSVADPNWIVRHVLEHGPDAEILSPASMRREVRRAVDRLLDIGNGVTP